MMCFPPPQFCIKDNFNCITMTSIFEDINFGDINFSTKKKNLKMEVKLLSGSPNLQTSSSHHLHQYQSGRRAAMIQRKPRR